MEPSALQRIYNYLVTIGDKSQTAPILRGSHHTVVSTQLISLRNANSLAIVGSLSVKIMGSGTVTCIKNVIVKYVTDYKCSIKAFVFGNFQL